MREVSGVGAGLGAEMGTRARTGAALLLMLALLLNVAGCAAKTASDDAKAKVFPWKTGDVIKAEYVDSDYGQGYIGDYFMTPEGVGFALMFDVGDECSENVSTKAWCTAKVTAFDAPDGYFNDDSDLKARKLDDPFFNIDPANLLYNSILDKSNLGRQMLITVLHVRDPKEPRFTAYRVQLDPDPEAPIYTKVLPNQEITGKTWCPNKEERLAGWDNEVYIITEQGQKYPLAYERGDPSRRTWRWCDVTDTVTLHGTFLLWTEDTTFRTSDVAWDYER